VREMYFPETTDESESYNFKDPIEYYLLEAFVLNEVVVGTILVGQLLTVMLCGALTKSAHLNEIEGEGFGVDDNEVRRIKQEIEESKRRTEGLRRKEVVSSSDIEVIKREARESDIEMMNIH